MTIMGYEQMSALSFEDSQEITDLIHEYCDAVDAYDIDRLVEVFAPDGSMCFTDHERGTVTGHDALRDQIAKVLGGFEATSHHVSNIRLTADAANPEVVHGVTYLYAWHRFLDDRPDGYLWGRYHDRFERGPNGWRIASRTLRIVGEQDFPMPWNPPDPPRRRSA